MTNVSCFYTAALRRARERGQALHMPLDLIDMKIPTSDLHEISLYLDAEETRTLVQVVDRRTEIFVVTFDALRPEATMSLIGREFPDHMKARNLGQVTAYLESHSESTQAVLMVHAQQGETASNIEVARAVRHMVVDGLDAAAAVHRARAITMQCIQFIQRNAARAEEARLALLKTA